MLSSMGMRVFGVLLLLPGLAGAYIEALTSLGGVVKESDVLLRGTVEAVSAEKKVLVLKVGTPIKGKTVYEKIRLDVGAGESWHPELVMKHAVPGTPVCVFYKKADGAEHAALALIYINRFFLAAQGGEQVWRLGKVELAMNKVYTGTPGALAEHLGKVVSGRSKPAAPNAAFKAWTREQLEALAAPPREGEAWAPFDPAAVFQK